MPLIFCKQYRRLAGILGFFVCALFFCLLPVQGAEILWQNGPDRVVSGDWAVWTTRGLSHEPAKAEIDEKTISDCVERIEPDD